MPKSTSFCGELWHLNVIMNLTKNNKGSVTMELSIFIAVICGMIFGYMAVMNGMKTSIALQVAAREGSRSYATTGSSTKAKEKANLELLSMGIVGATSKTLNEGSGRSVLIEKTYSYTIPLFGTYDTTLKGYCTFYEEPVFAEGE